MEPQKGVKSVWIAMSKKTLPTHGSGNRKEAKSVSKIGNKSSSKERGWLNPCCSSDLKYVPNEMFIFHVREDPIMDAKTVKNCDKLEHGKKAPTTPNLLTKR